MYENAMQRDDNEDIGKSKVTVEQYDMTLIVGTCKVVDCCQDWSDSALIPLELLQLLECVCSLAKSKTNKHLLLSEINKILTVELADWNSRIFNQNGIPRECRYEA